MKEHRICKEEDEKKFLVLGWTVDRLPPDTLLLYALNHSRLQDNESSRALGSSLASRSYYYLRETKRIHMLR